MRIVSIVYERRPSFEAARSEAGEGYQNVSLLSDSPTTPYDMSRTNIGELPVFFGHSMAALGVVASRLGKKKLKVLDVGGALGGHFATARTTFEEGLDFDWTVVETPLYADHGKRLITTPGLRFVSDLAQVADEEFDLAYFSSVFPYVPDLEAVLSAPAVRSAPYLFVSRTGMHDEEINFLQTVTYDIGVVRYPGRILSKPAFTERMGRDYELITSWQNEQYSVENRAYSAPSMLWRQMFSKARQQTKSVKRRVDVSVDVTGLEDLQQRRLSAALPYLQSGIDALDRWVTESKEVSNYTYNLTPQSKRQLASTIAVALSRPYEEIAGYINEIDSDSVLADTVVRRSESDVYFDTHDHSCLFGRRIGWYAVARALKPRVIVETGVDKGLGSMTLSSALLRNEAEGHPGRYFGTDIVPGAGFLLCEPYSRVAQLLIGDSIESLKTFDQPIDLFINDSDHSAQYEADEYEVVESKLASNAVVLGDNSHVTDALLNFANRTGRSFLFFREVPLNHWYPGAGIGIAFNKTTR